MKGPAEACSSIPSFVDVFCAPTPLIELLAKIITEKNWAGEDEDPSEIADSWVPRVRDRIRRIEVEAVEEGRYLHFCLNEANDDFIQGSCFIAESDNEELRLSKRRRARTIDYVGAFDSLTPLQFEALCGRILGLLQVPEPHVSRASADQGVDFFGRLSVGNFLSRSVLPTRAEKQLDIWLVGQAKHYIRTNVSTGDIRELVGSVELAKAKVFSGRSDPLEGLGIRPCDPVFYLFFTTGTLTKAAKDVLRRSGVVGMDGTQLAMLLADNEAGLVDDVFDLATFQTWIG